MIKDIGTEGLRDNKYVAGYLIDPVTAMPTGKEILVYEDVDLHIKEPQEPEIERNEGLM